MMIVGAFLIQNIKDFLIPMNNHRFAYHYAIKNL
jgi:hypothetical protein